MLPHFTQRNCVYLIFTSFVSERNRDNNVLQKYIIEKIRERV